MRLTCPNCDAEYSVDDAAIPPSGRDVQCSNCGHAWFQLHPDAEAAAASADALFAPARASSVAPAAAQETTPPAFAAAPRPVAVPPPAESHAAPPSPGEAEAAPDAESDVADAAAVTEVQPAVPPLASAAVSAAAPRTLDENLLAILREEAARETAVRRAEAPSMPEVQPDLGLTAATSATAPAPAPAATPELDTIEAGGAMQDRVAPRRDLLPDIEEINSTLRAGSEARGAEAEAMVAAEKARAKGGFRAGFIVTLFLAVLLTAAYTMAPRIAQHLPGSAPMMASYVHGVDVARIWLDDAMQKAAGTLRGLTGETP